MLTGFSPSVQRAAAMFSFITLGQSISRNVSIYNILAGSAFFLLCFNPYLIVEVGFQLSYLAVVGIVYLQPKIYRFWVVKNWLGDKMWGITAVSIAAQIATFPLGLYYFHKFPVYFLVANLFVIPGAAVILYVGVAIFIFHLVHLTFISDYLTIALNGIIWLLNQIVFTIENFPNSIINGISITFWQAVLIYAGVILLCASFVSRRLRLWNVAILVFLFLLSVSLVKSVENIDQKKLIVYDISNQTALEIVDGTQVSFYGDSALLANESSLLFHVQQNWWKMGIKKTQLHVLEKAIEFDTIQSNAQAGWQCLNFAGKRIVMLNADFKPADVLEELEVDYLILGKSPHASIAEILRDFKPAMIIFDSSNRIWKVNDWIKECESLEIKCHSVKKDGAFIANLN
jgi:competence protein ComEC